MMVSVIIPVFQGERMILGAVRSALNQTHRDLEVIVVDDGSTDGTLRALAQLDDPRLTVHRQANAGTGAARNYALSLARGQYIAFLDSDDRWFPNKLERELEVLRSAPAAVAIAYSSYYAVDDRGRLLNAAPARTYAGSALDLLLDGEDFLMPSVCLFDRRVFDTLGVFKPERYHEDHEYILRAARRYPIFPTGERLVVYRQSTEGKCRKVLSDFAQARAAELAVVDDFEAVLTPEQSRRFRQNAMRSLYCRFLMYGFERHARRIQDEVEIGALRFVGKKGWLAWFFALTGINLLKVARSAIQSFHLLAGQRAWLRRLGESRLELRYE
jgi:glycosyltransferase involved in cell wall biosynthesis